MADSRSAISGPSPSTGWAGWLVPAVLSVTLLMAAVASLFAGSVPISAPEIARALLGGNETVREIIVWQLRVPRTLLAMLIGASLGLAGALTALALNLSPNPYAVTEIIFWMMGSLADRSFEHVTMETICMLPGWLLLFSTRRALDALSLGEDTATSLGFNVGTVRLCGSGAGGGSGSSGSGGGLDTGSVRQQTLFLPIRRRHAVAESRARSSCASRS